MPSKDQTMCVWNTSTKITICDIVHGADPNLRVLDISSTIAVSGLIILILQTLVARCIRRRNRPRAEAQSILPATPRRSYDKPQKPAATYGGLASGPAKIRDMDEAWRSPLHERLDALVVQDGAMPLDEATLEIASATAAYLTAAEDLLRLRRAGTGGGKPRMTLAELRAAARLVVRDNTAATASLGEGKTPSPGPAGALAVLIGSISLIATQVAAWEAAVPKLPLRVGFTLQCLFMVILGATMLAAVSSARAKREDGLDDAEKQS